ncbi:hypothetical protein BH11ACT8_BH11ACT8_33780 [soil metagenome]
MRTTQPIACTSDVLTLNQPVGALPSSTREAVTQWLQAHDIDPVAVAVGRPIERDAQREMLVWREEAEDGVLVRTRFPAVNDGAVWPAPFPHTLLRSA